MKAICSRRLAFTLIELLVVISIIAILASLTFTGVQTAMIAAKKVMAKNDMAQICNGVQFYYTEYGKYPAPATFSGTTDTVYGISGGDNSGIINILRCTGTWATADSASGSPQNSRQIQFLQPKVTAVAKGCVYSSDGNWYDPWGTQYLIFIDTAYDGDITVSTQITDFTTNPSFGVGAAAVGYYYAKAKTNPQPPRFNGTGVSFTANKATVLLSWQ